MIIHVESEKLTQAIENIRSFLEVGDIKNALKYYYVAKEMLERAELNSQYKFNHDTEM